jgi:hypothetical protein
MVSRFLRCSLLAFVLAVLGVVPALAATLDADEQAFVTLINTYRQQNGLVPLKISDRLQAAAEWMSLDMAQKNYFNHTDSLGRDPFQRMTAFGYAYSTYKGENIAAGHGTATETFDQWKNSAGHNANMLNGNYRVMGIGRAYVAGSTYRYYWTNDFGGYDDSGTPLADTTAPTVSLTAPANGATVSGTLTVQASAGDNVGVSRVTLTVDNGSTQTDSATPYAFTLNTTTLANGSHTLTATAYDAAGNSRAASIMVLVDNAPADTVAPLVTITAPASGATVSGRLRIAAAITDNVGVKLVAYRIDGGARVYDGAAPYEYYLDTAVLVAGTHIIEVTAWDPAGNSGRAQSTFTVQRDAIAPTISITSPVDGATVGGAGNLAVRVTASDNVAVTKVVFQVDGGSTLTDGAAPWELWLNGATLATGTHTIAATAYDAAGNTAWGQVTFTVAR